MNKLSAVKQKGANPKWQPKQQQQSSDKKDNEESEKKPHAHGCHSSCEVKKCQAKQANYYGEDEAKSSQLTSSAFMAASPAFTTVTGHKTVIPLAQPQHFNQLLVRATPLNIPKWASCRLYKNSGLSEMRLMGWLWLDMIRNSKGVVGWDRRISQNMVEYPKRTQLGCPPAHIKFIYYVTYILEYLIMLRGCMRTGMYTIL